MDLFIARTKSCDLIGAGTYPLIFHLLKKCAEDLCEAGFGCCLIDGVLAS